MSKKAIRALCVDVVFEAKTMTELDPNIGVDLDLFAEVRSRFYKATGGYMSSDQLEYAGECLLELLEG